MIVQGKLFLLQLLHRKGECGRGLHRTFMMSKMSIEESWKLPICNMAIGSIENVNDIK